MYTLFSIFTSLLLIPFLCIYFYKYNIRCVICPKTTIPNKLRIEYYDELSKYIKQHKPNEILENELLQVYMNDFGENTVIRVRNKINNKMFEIYTELDKPKNDENIATIYGIIQMYFTRYITYNGIKDWCEHRGHTLCREINFP